MGTRAQSSALEKKRMNITPHVPTKQGDGGEGRSGEELSQGKLRLVSMQERVWTEVVRLVLGAANMRDLFLRYKGDIFQDMYGTKGMCKEWRRGKLRPE